MNPDRTYRLPQREFFTGFALENTKCEANLGIVMRTVCCLGVADFMATVGERYHRPRTDVVDSYRQLPVFNYKDYEDLVSHMPEACDLVAVEQTERSVPLHEFQWPKRCLVVGGTEGNGLSRKFREHARYVVSLPSIGVSLNVSSAMSIVAYKRWEWLKTNGFQI